MFHSIMRAISRSVHKAFLITLCTISWPFFYVLSLLTTSSCIWYIYVISSVMYLFHAYKKIGKFLFRNLANIFMQWFFQSIDWFHRYPFPNDHPHWHQSKFPLIVDCLFTLLLHIFDYMFRTACMGHKQNEYFALPPFA